MNSFADGAPYDLSAIRKASKSIFLICTRNKNDNVVIYEVQLHPDGTIRDPAIEGYWLMARKHDAQGKLLPQDQWTRYREEFNYLERTIAYGFTSKRISGDRCTFTFDQKPEVTFHIKVKQGKAVALIAHEGSQYRVVSLYIEASENLQLFPLSNNIKTLRLSTIHLKTKQPREIFLKQL